MEPDVYDALIESIDAANEKIPDLVRYLRICGYPATGSSEGDAVTDPEVEVGDYTIQIPISGGYCLTRQDTEGKIRFWPTRRVMGSAVNDLIEALKEAPVPGFVEQEAQKYRLYQVARSGREAEETLETLQSDPDNPAAILIPQAAKDGAVYNCVYLEITNSRGRR